MLRCEGLTKYNIRCKRSVKDGKFCLYHNTNKEVKKINKASYKCSGIRSNKKECNNKVFKINDFCNCHLSQRPPPIILDFDL